MKLTQKLLSLLHRVFDPDPEHFLALRISYSGGMSWTVSDSVLTTCVVGGIGQGLTIDLTTLTLSQLVSTISAQPGYQVLYADGSANLNLSARVLMDGSANIAQSNGDHLYAYTSLIWVYMEAVGSELKAAKAQIPEAINQMSIPTASDNWIDELGSYYDVPRLSGEQDPSYGARIIAETVRPRANNVAIERAISHYTGQATKVIDVTIYGASFPKYNGAVTRNSVYRYQPISTHLYGLFDVQLGYDLLGGVDQTAFAAIVAGIVERLRSAGTHMRALSLQSSAISDKLTPPIDGAMTLVATPVLADALTAPSEGTFAIAGTLTSMSDSATVPKDGSFDAIRYDYCYNGVRTRNGAIKYAGNTLETNPVLAKEWSFLTGELPTDVTVLRSTIGTRYNQHGVIEIVPPDVARINYDPYTGLPLGLLIEEARSNLITYSSDFTNAAWGKSRCKVTRPGVRSPNDLLEACLIVPSTDNNTHSIGFTVASIAPSSSITESFYVKAGGYSQIRLRLADDVGFLADVVFDAVTGQKIIGGASAIITQLIDGWYRIELTAITSAASTAMIMQLWLYSEGSPTFSGDAVNGIYVWHAQMEIGTFATTPIPTLGAVETRAADLASIDTLSPWYNPTQGTLCLWSTNRQPSNAVTFGLSIGTDNQNYIGLCYTGTAGSMGGYYIRNANVGSNINDSVTDRTRTVVAWDNTNVGLATDGTYRGTGVSAGAPAATSMRIGRGHYGGSVVTGHYRKITYWSDRFPDSTLRTLSTNTI